EFIARMLCPGARRSRAGITKDEKAKKTPAERPQPRAVARVRYWTRRLMPRSEERLAETVHGQIARLHARASTSGLRGDLHVLRPLGIDRVELGAHVDVVPGPLEGEDARRLAVAGGEPSALLGGVEDAIRLRADLRDDQRVGHGDDGAIMGRWQASCGR